ncbi:outer membrane beta-barrel protein [Kiritimatiella glycovorans]|nr:outer membrane beta-barrel protein [Kiritimatiella glycovorans]
MLTAGLLFATVSHLQAAESMGQFKSAIQSDDARKAGHEAAAIVKSRVEGDVSEEAVMELAAELVEQSMQTGDERTVKWVSAGVLKGGGPENFKATALGIDVVTEGTKFEETGRQVVAEVGRLMNGDFRMAAAAEDSEEEEGKASRKKRKTSKPKAGGKTEWQLPGYITELFTAGSAFWDLSNRMYVRWDDNLYTDDDKDDGWSFNESFTLSTRMGTDRTDFYLHYRPTYRYSPEKDDDQQLFHEFSGQVNHSISPRTMLRLSDTFQYKEQPERVVSGRNTESTYYRNKVNLSADHALHYNSRLNLSVGNEILRYDEDLLSDRHDMDKYRIGGSLSRQIVPNKTVGFVNASFQRAEYVGANRNAGTDTMLMTLGMSHVFNPDLTMEGYLGASQTEFENNVRGDDYLAPYARAKVYYQFSPRTTVHAGAGYSFNEESTEFTYASSLRQDYALGVKHELTGKLTFDLTGSYYIDEYESEFLIPGTGIPIGVDGQTYYSQVRSRLTYDLNRMHSFDVGYRFTDLQSDIATRDDWDRNQVEFGWRMKF